MPSEEPAPRRHTLVVYLAVLTILVTGAWTYGQVVTFEFVTGDDRALIVENSAVHSWHRTPWKERLLTTRFTYVMPVTQLSFALDWQLWGGSAGGFHLTNLALHLACSLLVFFIARRLFGAPTSTVTLAALVGALVFQLHPLQAEAVSYITQRKDLLGTLFALLAFNGLLRMRTATRAGLYRPMVLIAVALAGLAKPTQLLLGPVLAASCWFFRRGTRVKPAELGFYIALILIAPLLFGLNWYVHAQSPDTLDTFAFALPQRLMLFCRTIEHYLQSLILPLHLAPKVPRPDLGLAAVPIALAGAVLAAFFFLFVRMWIVNARVGLVLATWCVGMYLPISNAIPIRRYVADGYVYAVMVGVALVVARVSLWLLGDRRRRARFPLAVAFGVIFGVTGHLADLQASVWRDEGTLYRRLYRLFPSNTSAVQLYSDHLKRTGRARESRVIMQRFLEQAVLQRPRSLPARHRLMRLYLTSGMVQQADRLIAETPEAAREQTAYWEARLELAMHTRRYADALRAVRKILQLDPGSPRRRLLQQLERRQRNRASRQDDG